MDKIQDPAAAETARIKDSPAVALPCLVMLLIDPQQDHFKWAIVDGSEVVERGKSLTADEIKEVARRQCIADVFIDEGYRTFEIRKLAKENRWHCVKGRSGRRRDGIAEMIERACEHNS